MKNRTNEVDKPSVDLSFGEIGSINVYDGAARRVVSFSAS